MSMGFIPFSQVFTEVWGAGSVAEFMGGNKAAVVLPQGGTSCYKAARQSQRRTGQREA